jgi:hypothetical protein
MKTEIFTSGLLASLASASFATRAVQVADCLTGKKVPVSWQSDPNYAELAEPFNLRLAWKPKVIVLPTNNKHVQDAVKCANECGLKVQARSGGHSYASYSSGGQDGSMGEYPLFTTTYSAVLTHNSDQSPGSPRD